MIPSIQMHNGKFMDFRFPGMAEYSIDDIAHALSHICRFTGHVNNFYSVAQHSVLVSYLVPEEHALAGLLHDAAEAFLGDVASPLKQLLPEYKQIELRVEKSIMQRFGIPFPLDTCVKEADRIMLVTERRDLMPKSDNSNEWEWAKDIKPQTKKIIPWNYDAARKMFVFRFNELTS